MASAWFGTGHLLVARTAYEILKVQSPGTITAVENILKPLTQSDPSWTKSEGNHPMVECATFADEIKGKGARWQSGWHFVDTPYLDGGDTIDNYPDFKFEEHNATNVIQELAAWFRKDPGYQNSYSYQTIMSHTYQVHTEETGASTAMRLLIHYVGDIHQPLHATSRVNKKYPAGDRGGNSVPLPNELKELHAVWDSIMFEFSGYPKLPFSSADWAKNGDDAKRMMSDYKIDESVATNLDVNQWTEDSHELSSNFVYKGVVENQPLSEQYKKDGLKIAEKQVIIAGNRLANLLMSFNLEAGNNFLN